MKKTLTSGIVFSMLIGIGAASADEYTALTTKNYVDSGLRAVYGTATAAATAASNAASAAATAQSGVNTLTSTVSTLSDTVGTNTANIASNASDIAALQSAVTTLQSSDTTAYEGGLGVTVSDHTVSVTGLATSKAEGNTTKRYVYQNGALIELEVANSWDSSILN